VTRDTVAWGAVNRPISEENFQNLYDRAMEYLNTLDEVFVFEGYVGADPEHSMPLRVSMSLRAKFICSAIIYST